MSLIRRGCGIHVVSAGSGRESPVTAACRERNNTRRQGQAAPRVPIINLDETALQDGRVTEVYLEAGKRRVFACAPRWPGWCRPGRGEEAALAALAAAAPRYAEVCARAGFAFDPVEAAAGFEVLERVTGSATTDFGALDVAPAAVERVRAGILAEIRAGAARAPEELARSRRPARFVARRTAWHALDHAWEILDKQEPR